jgi:hypothetical protein
VRLVAIVGPYEAVEDWFWLAGLQPDYFLVAESEDTRYVGWHSGLHLLEEQRGRYDEVIRVEAAPGGRLRPMYLHSARPEDLLP